MSENNSLVSVNLDSVHAEYNNAAVALRRAAVKLKRDYKVDVEWPAKYKPFQIADDKLEKLKELIGKKTVTTGGFTTACGYIGIVGGPKVQALRDALVDEEIIDTKDVPSATGAFGRNTVKLIKLAGSDWKANDKFDVVK